MDTTCNICYDLEGYKCGICEFYLCGYCLDKLTDKSTKGRQLIDKNGNCVSFRNKLQDLGKLA